MVDAMELDPLFEMPGGDDFQDVTELFTEAAEAMDPEYLMVTEGFTLLDAMSAFEIGEPRMDSGMILEQQKKPPFNPLMPMLPQELCWIMDRMFTCEMEWHVGNSLSQTVYTLLYVHYLRDINPDFIPRQSKISKDPLRPPELITLVLRAVVFGLLKSCDLSWRELSKGKVHEIEDWFGEKCDISLLEGVATDAVIRKLDDACHWLWNSSVDKSDVALLCDRLLLRKTILQLLKLTFPMTTTELHSLVAGGREILHRIRAQHIQPPGLDSPALLVFDPHISRRLPNFMPVRVLELPPSEDTWNAIEHFFDGYEELGHLLDSPCLSTWEIAGSLRIWSSKKKTQVAYLRSLMQCAVFDKTIFFGRYPQMWLVDRFFLETVGVSYDIILQSLNLGDKLSAHSLVRDTEKRVIKLMVSHVRSYWYNPPRRRRYLAKSIVQWHELYDHTLQLIALCPQSGPGRREIIECMPRAAMIRRLSAAREVIMSGFQQDLYAPAEVPIAYWYVARVLDMQLSCIDEVLSFAAKDWEGRHEMEFQSRFLTALQIMAIAMCSLTYKQSTWTYTRTSLNFVKRYKWSFSPEYDNLVPALPPPHLHLFAPQVSEILQDEYYSPSGSFQLAGSILHDLSKSSVPQGYAGLWATTQQDFVCGLADLCRRLEAVPAFVGEIAAFDITRLKWENRVHPWFPDIVA